MLVPKAFAQSCADLKTVDSLFSSYCGGDDENPRLCQGPLKLTGAAAQLMIVSDYCALSSPKPNWCACLNAVAKPKILAFDHVDEQWMPQGQFDPERPKSTFWYENETLRGTPRVRIGGDEELTVVVTRTNPLIFAASLGTPEVADVAELTAAKALLSAAGGALATGMAGAAAFAAAALDVPPPDPGKARVTAALAELNNLLDQWDARIKEMAEATDGLLQQWNALTSAMQAIESRRVLATTAPAGALASLDTSVDIFYVPDLLKWTGALRSLTDFHAQIGSCKADLGSQVSKFDDLLKGMKLTSVCRLRLWERSLWDKDLWDDATVTTAIRLLTTLTDAQTRLAGVLDRKESIAGSVASLLDAFGRVSRYGVYTESTTVPNFPGMWNSISSTETYRMHIAMHLLVAEEAMAGRWDHTQTYPVGISRVKGPVASVISPLRGDLAPKYRVEQKVWSALGFSVGVLARSTAEVRSWEKAGPENARIVRRTNSTGRAGRIAAFVNYRFVEAANPAASQWRVRPGVEFGVATDGTNPGVLIGMSLELARVLRIGWGTSWFVLPELDGLQEGPIAENDTIRTRSTFKGGLPYVSVTLALDSLSVFASK